MKFIHLRGEALLQGVHDDEQGLVVVPLELGVGWPQLVDPLEDLGEAGDDEGELELGDLDDAVFVLLDIAARVVGLWACPAWQLVLEPGEGGSSCWQENLYFGCIYQQD